MPREPRHPSTRPLEREYAAEARRRLVRVNKRILRDPHAWLENPTYEGVGDMVDRGSLGERLMAEGERIARRAAQQARILMLSSGMGLRELIARLGIANVRSLRTVDVAPTLTQQQQIVAWAQEGVDRIVTLSRSETVGLERVVAEWVRRGERVEDLTIELQRRLSIGARHARLIARDQVGKLTSHIQNDTLKSAGVEYYIWRTVKDQRVRDEHERLEGMRFAVNGPGAPGAGVRGEHSHPGQAIQCRCYRQPVIEL